MLLLWKPHIEQTSETCRAFVLTVYDWCAHLSDVPSLWVQYDGSLLQTCHTALIESPSLHRHWVSLICQAPLSHRTLLYRHYVTEQALQGPIFALVNQPLFYLNTSAMLTDTIVFARYDELDVLASVTTAANPIDRLRVIQPVLIECLIRLHQQSGGSIQTVLEDHALLSSFNLLYGLSLSYVILRHDTHLHPHTVSQTLQDSLLSTLTQIQGVLTHAY